MNINILKLDLPKVLYENVDEVEELRNMRDGFYDKEINLGMNYTSEDYVKCSIRGSRSYSNNEEGSEDEIVTRYEDRKNEELKKKI
jgi:hypothetical protein